MTLTVSLLLKANATQAKAEVRTMHDELRQLNIQMDGNKAQQFVNAWAGVKPAMSSAEQSARALGEALDLQEEFDRLRQATDPAYAATVRFAHAQDIATRAVKAGAIAQADADAVMKRLGGSSIFTGNSMRMVSQQLSQVGQQTMVTGNFVQALAIQLPDIGVGFGAIGAAAGLLAGIALPMVISAFSGTEDKAKETADRIDDLEAAVTKYATSAKNAMKPTAELAKEYGNLAGKAKEAFKAIAEADRQSALASLKDSKAAVASSFGGFDMGVEGLPGSPLEDTLLRIRTELGATGEEAVKVQQSLQALAKAEGPVQIATAAEAARKALLDAGVAANGPLVEAINAVWSEAVKLQATTDDVSTATYSVRDAANSAAAAMAGIGSAAAGAYGAVAALAAKAWEAGQARLAATRKYTTPDASGRMVDKEALYAQMKGRGVKPIVAKEDDYKLPDDWNKPVKAKGGGGGGAGADAAKKEAQAVSDLIKKLEDEQAVLRETDPVKQEMLKHRKELAAASQTERQRIEELIRAEVQLKSVREATDFMASTSLDALKGIVAGGDEASNAMKRLADSILDAALQAVWLGEGPLAGILGISGSIFGSIFGGKAGAAIPAKAEGGLLFGEGSGRADKLPLWGSAGEFMVNARATARHRPLLERINNGQPIPGFAAGGAIGGQRSGEGGGASAPKLEQHIHLYSATGNTEIQEMVAKGVQTGLDLHDREVLPTRVKGILQDPRRSGR